MALLRRNLIWLFAAVLLFPVFAQAQSRPLPDTFRIISLGAITPLSYAFDARTTTTISLPAGSSYSKPYPVPPDGRLTFYRMSPAPDPAKPAVKTVVAEIKLRVRSIDAATPPSPYLLVLIPSAQLAKPPTDSSGNPLEFQTLLLDDSFKAHPKNHVRVINFSRRLAAVALDRTAHQMKPLESKIIPYPVGDRGRLQVASLLNNSWMSALRQTQMFEPNSRLTIFVCDEQPNEFDPNPVGLDLRKIPEVFPPDSSESSSSTPNG